MTKAYKVPTGQRTNLDKTLISSMVCGAVDCSGTNCRDCLFSSLTKRRAEEDSKLQDRINQKGCEILLDLLEKDK